MSTSPEGTTLSEVEVDPAERRRIANEKATAQLRNDFEHKLNIRYGTNPKQVFDCYLPNGEPAGPVRVFLHGGGFRLGAPGPVAYYGRPILERGGIFVSLGYRLAPEVRFPDTVLDAELGLAEVVRFTADLVGEAGTVFLSGHSAGAALAAFTALRPQTHEAASISGLVLVSGMYDLRRHTDEVGNTSSERYVPVLTDAIEHVPPSTIVVAGDNDLPAVMPAAEAMLEAIRGKGAAAEFFLELDADHFKAIRGFATPGEPVAEAVLAMMGL